MQPELPGVLFSVPAPLSRAGSNPFLVQQLPEPQISTFILLMLSCWSSPGARDINGFILLMLSCSPGARGAWQLVWDGFFWLSCQICKCLAEHVGLVLVKPCCVSGQTPPEDLGRKQCHVFCCFCRYLAKNSSALFSASDYEVAPPEYHRKAV